VAELIETLRRVGVAAALSALLVAGCGGNDEEQAAPPPPPPPATTAPAGQTAECGTLDGGGTAARTNEPGAEIALLTDVSFEAADCVDRITFDFREDLQAAPGYTVEYRPADQALVEDGSGNRIELEGDAYLVVRFEPAATGDLSGEELVITYEGPRRFETDGRYVREVVKSGDFEAVLTWVIGVSEQRPFRVVESSSPPRLVVEVG
jgi:hypothetical protein